ncbi:uncharacterized protein [Venturia canescens]|uniref:uncharacterized protein n=1 Tax=Venturia canescens TaxID=32260 RepID=UPI001C9D64CE|nr:uncharacterized protein LOC122411497 [Venturia canescens]
MKLSTGSKVPLCIFACLLFVAVANAMSLPSREAGFHSQCPPGYTGLVAFPRDCTKFIECDGVSGRVWIRDCAPGTGFDLRHKYCGRKYLIAECPEFYGGYAERETNPIYPGFLGNGYIADTPTMLLVINRNKETGETVADVKH